MGCGVSLPVEAPAPGLRPPERFDVERGFSIYPNTQSHHHVHSHHHQQQCPQVPAAERRQRSRQHPTDRDHEDESEDEQQSRRREHTNEDEAHQRPKRGLNWLRKRAERRRPSLRGSSAAADQAQDRATRGRNSLVVASSSSPLSPQFTEMRAENLQPSPPPPPPHRGRSPSRQQQQQPPRSHSEGAAPTQRVANPRHRFSLASASPGVGLDAPNQTLRSLLSSPPAAVEDRIETWHTSMESEGPQQEGSQSQGVGGPPAPVARNLFNESFRSTTSVAVTIPENPSVAIQEATPVSPPDEAPIVSLTPSTSSNLEVVANRRARGTHCRLAAGALPSSGRGTTSVVSSLMATLDSDELQDEATCAICTDLLLDAFTLECSHTFCKDCLQTWLREQCICPMCRMVVDPRTVVRNRPLNNLIERFVDKMDDASPIKIERQRRMLSVFAENAQQQQQRNSLPPRPSPPSLVVAVSPTPPPPRPTSAMAMMMSPANPQQLQRRHTMPVPTGIMGSPRQPPQQQQHLASALNNYASSVAGTPSPMPMGWFSQAAGQPPPPFASFSSLLPTSSSISHPALPFHPIPVSLNPPALATGADLFDLSAFARGTAAFIMPQPPPPTPIPFQSGDGDLPYTSRASPAPGISNSRDEADSAFASPAPHLQRTTRRLRSAPLVRPQANQMGYLNHSSPPNFSSIPIQGRLVGVDGSTCPLPLTTPSNNNPVVARALLTPHRLEEHQLSESIFV